MTRLQDDDGEAAGGGKGEEKPAGARRLWWLFSGAAWPGVHDAGGGWCPIMESNHDRTGFEPVDSAELV